jgi:hypothetical protein
MGQRIGAVISEVVIELVAVTRTLELRQECAAPAELPTQFGHPRITNGVLHYGGWFDAGGEGCWSVEELAEFIDLHFRCFEGGETTRFQTKDLPLLTSRITTATQIPKPVEWKFEWGSIFGAEHEQKHRRIACETLCGGTCLPKLVAAIEQVRCSVLDGVFHSRRPLDPTHSSSGVHCSYRCHHKSCRNAEGLRISTSCGAGGLDYSEHSTRQSGQTGLVAGHWWTLVGVQCAALERCGRVHDHNHAAS